MTVYAIQAESGGPIKVGCSDNLSCRLSTLSALMKSRLRLIGQADGMHKEEKCAHRYLANWRIGGEWFREDAPIDDAFRHVYQWQQASAYLRLLLPPLTDDQEKRNALMVVIERRSFDARIAITNLCKEAKVSPTTASRWKNDRIIPSLETIGKLERALDDVERKRSGGAIGSSAGTNGTGPDQSAKES